MKLKKINESWDDEGIQDPSNKPTITNTGYMLQLIMARLAPEFSMHKANYLADGAEAQFMDTKTGIFYNITIKPDTTSTPK